MKLLSSIRTILAFVFRRHRVEREMEEELCSHLRRRTDDLERQGLARAEAERQARIEFGGFERYKEECREALGTRLLQELIADLRFGLRQLRRNPGFTAVAIATLVLGLAAIAAIFSVINGVLLQPLDYANPSQLVALQLFMPAWAHKFPMVPLNPATYLAWSRQAKLLAGISVAEEGDTLNLTGAGEPALLSADAVTANLFNVLGVRPQMGRNFLPGADHAGPNHEVILTDGLWRNRFHRDPSILGRTITLNGTLYTVVGILPSSFHFPTQHQLIPIEGDGPKADLFVPLVFEKEDLAADAGFRLATIARMKPGVSQAQATAELNVILSRQFRQVPLKLRPRTVMMPLRDMIVRSSKRGLWLLFAAVLSVLLIICVNLANLALTRATAREHEAAVRSALGAGRGRLLRQSLTEMVLLGLVGGALGLLLAHWALRGLLAIAPSGLPRLNNVRLDSAVVGFILVVSVLAGLLAGLLPAWRMAQANPQDALRSGGMRAGETRARLRVRDVLVGAGTAFTTMLLIAAGLLIASFAKLENVPKGFAVDHILTVNLQLPSAQYTKGQQRKEFWRRVLAATSTLPGVESSAVTNWMVLAGEMNDDPVNLPGDTRPQAERRFASYRRVSPAYFKALGIPLLRGRGLTWTDVGTPAVVISEATAKAVWPGVDPIGQRFDVDPSFRGFQVVGVVGDTRSVTLTNAPTPMVYQPYHGDLTGSLILRTRLRSTAVAPELRRAIWKVDSSVAVPRIRSMGQIVSASLAPRRFETLLTSLFGGAALLLACLGIYGVVSYSVLRRTHEIGIRMALGAQKRDVLRLVVGQGMMPVLLGLGAGIIGALALMRLVSSLLYGVKPTDLVTFVVVALVLASTALLACYVPARRAAKVDPMEALRYE
ncbi:MAG TPA: ABC transporter permease [Terriglobia bacterium]|nr:ABC transporter permease [Terriglobia bacterium]